MEDTAFIEDAFGPDAPAEGRNELLADIQAQARPPDIGPPRAIMHARKAREHVWQVIWRYAHSLVAHGDRDGRAVGLARGDLNCAAGGRIFNGVREQIAQDMLERGSIGLDAHTRRDGLRDALLRA